MVAMRNNTQQILMIPGISVTGSLILESDTQICPAASGSPILHGTADVVWGIQTGELCRGQGFTGTGNSITTTNELLNAISHVCPQCVPPPADLVSWWPGEGDASDTIGDNPGTLVGGVDFVDGMVGQAFNFDGRTGYVNVPSSDTLSLNSDFTIDAWVNPNLLPAELPAPILNKYNFSGQSWANTSYELSIRNNGTLQFGVTCDRTDMVGATTTAVPIGQFTHVAAVYQNNPPSMQIYVNGVLQPASTTGSCSFINQNDIPVHIGHRRDAAVDSFFDGLIDEVDIYNRALTAQEIRSIYAARRAGKCQPE